MFDDRLTDENYLIFCAKHYDNPQCDDVEEFMEDLKRIKYIKKLITRYIDTGDLKERLILNHIIVLHNVFPPKILCRILFLKMYDQMKYIKPFLILLNILPEKVYAVGKHDVIDTNDIPMDNKIIEILRKI